jgi:hypothetical protein
MNEIHGFKLNLLLKFKRRNNRSLLIYFALNGEKDMDLIISINYTKESKEIQLGSLSFSVLLKIRQI